MSLAAFGIASRSVSAATLNIGGTNSVVRYNMSGTAGVTIYSGVNIRDVTVDSVNDEVYYIANDGYYQYILRDNDPSAYDPGYGDRDTLLSYWDPNSVTLRMEVDPAGRQLIMTRKDPRGPSTYFNRPTFVYTRDVDTGSQNTLYTGTTWYIIRWQGTYNPSPLWGRLNDVKDVAFDPVGQHAYWADSANGTIMRTNVDGSGGTTTVYSGLVNPTSLVIDASGRDIFWVDGGDSTTDASILSGSMTGGAASTLVGGLTTAPTSLDLDPSSGKLYWADGTIHRANYDGTNPENVLNSGGGALGGMIVAIGHDSGNTPQNPHMPDINDGSGFIFEDITPSQQNQILFFDPVYATGYEYHSDGSNFASVLLPNIGDGLFDLYLWNGVGFVFDQEIASGVVFDFGPLGVSRFFIDGIEESAMLDPDDPSAFLTGLSFVDTNTTNVTMTAVPEPATAALLALGCLALRTRKKVRREPLPQAPSRPPA